MSLEKTKQTKIDETNEKWPFFVCFVYFRLFRILSSLFLITLNLLSITLAQVGSTDFGDISVKVDMLSNMYHKSGYDEYRATITNRSITKTHQVTLIGPHSTSRSHGPGFVELKRTVDVSPSTTSTISLFMPRLMFSINDFNVEVDGQRHEDLLLINVGSTSRLVLGSTSPVMFRGSNSLPLLLSRSVSESGLMNERAVEEGFKDPSGHNEVAYFASDLPLNAWSTNWLGYSRFDAVSISAGDLRALPEAVRSALWRYVECGGSLLIFGTWDIPIQWRERRELLTGGVDLETFYVGFGAVTVTGSVDPKQINASQWSKIKLIWEEARHEPVPYPKLDSINEIFPVVDRIGVPVRGLFLLMILFVMVIGPINMIWLARRGKKIWLLWTVPAISLLTCLAVTAFSLLKEGWSATARTEALTILDERSHRATTIGWTGFYSPMTPSEGLHFNYDTELTPQLPSSWHYTRTGGQGRTIDLTNDQHLSSGWITARVPSFFKIRKSETRRERLSVRQGANGTVSIVNGLGAGIRQLWWADSAGNIYNATNIPAGAESNLTPINIQTGANADQLRLRFSDTDWLSTFNNIEANPRELLMPNSYLAVLDASPFIEEGMGNVNTRNAKTLVYGIQAGN
jgi:hypothetical protein